MIATADGSDVTTGTPTVYYTIDNGTQTTGTGVATHKGNGEWSYVPVQAETNGNHVAFTMVLASASSQTVNVWPVAFDPSDADDLGLTALTGHTPQTGDSFARIGATGSGLTSVAQATVCTEGRLAELDAANLPADIDAILADTGTGGVVISATTANQIADALLNRDFSSVSDTNARTALNALRFLRNKYSVAGTTLTITKEDDTTTAWTSTVTTDASAEPITGSDPA